MMPLVLEVSFVAVLPANSINDPIPDNSVFPIATCAFAMEKNAVIANVRVFFIFLVGFVTGSFDTIPAGTVVKFYTLGSNVINNHSFLRLQNG